MAGRKQPASMKLPKNTMSFAAGDINNDGGVELFAADMMPYEPTQAALLAWAPLMETMEDVDVAHDQQIIQNVLQVATGDGGFENQAVARGVEATGWSWSAQFGDLDQDGFSGSLCGERHGSRRNVWSSAE